MKYQLFYDVPGKSRQFSDELDTIQEAMKAVPKGAEYAFVVQVDGENRRSDWLWWPNTEWSPTETKLD